MPASWPRRAPGAKPPGVRCPKALGAAEGLSVCVQLQGVAGLGGLGRRAPENAARPPPQLSVGGHRRHLTLPGPGHFG
eukprot:CAMPEP_0170328378 /NCGR_PEP_ID=MMETSP0116_2-20130129/65092_1 /TAXON_ID=400756 /ORGANISM="Durinskia baltica, Strain CSIRO CS-38" /LENGTH=77 /DNA_ID=CAMNT_0010581487 /DNA_START=48 /DNA_END=277 /DNA_ORIENTATION=-